VELALCDNRGNRIILSIETWKLLMQKRADIERLQSAETPLWIRDMILEVVQMSNSKIIKMTLFNNSLYMQPSTFLHLFDFENCIRHMYSWLSENTYSVNEKFEKFVAVLQRNDIIDVCNAAKVIRESDAFDGESLIDCELLTCAINDILHDACNKIHTY
jgi:hypothetical protein